MTAARCPGCQSGTRRTGMYLCLGCWNKLTAAARRALNRRDSKAFARLRELHQQLDASVPHSEIRITP